MTAAAGLFGGLGLGLLSAATCSVGVAVQKRAALTLPPAHGFSGATILAFLSHRVWLAGNVLTLAAWGLHGWALSLAPLTIVQPAMAIGVPVLTVLAVRWFHERLGRREWAGVAACSAGIAIEALSVRPGIDAAAVSTDWAGMAVVSGALLFASFQFRPGTAHDPEPSSRARRTGQAPHTDPEPSSRAQRGDPSSKKRAHGLPHCVRNDSRFMESVAAKRASAGSTRAEVGRAVAAGSLYAIVALLTKALMLSLHDGQMPLTVALVVALVVLSVVALGILQAAYQQGRAVVVMTITTVLADFSPVVLTMAVFHETWPGGAAGWWRALASALLVTGIFLLARSAAAVATPAPGAPAAP